MAVEKINIDLSDVLNEITGLSAAAQQLFETIRANAAKGATFNVEVNRRTGNLTKQGREELQTGVGEFVRRGSLFVPGSTKENKTEITAAVTAATEGRIASEAAITAANYKLADALALSEGALKAQGAANAAVARNAAARNATEKEILSKDQQYINSRVKSIIAMDRTTATERDQLAHSAEAAKQRIALARTTAVLNTKMAEEILRADGLVAERAKAAAAKNELANAERAEAAAAIRIAEAKSGSYSRLKASEAERDAQRAAENAINTALIEAKAREAVSKQQSANLTRIQQNKEFANNQTAQSALIERTRSDLLLAESLKERAIAENVAAGLTRQQARVAAGRAVSAAGLGGGSDTPGFGTKEFFGSGLKTTLKYSLPSAALFSAARAVSSLLKESEDLIQTNIRLSAQFENLGTLGAFDSLVDGFSELNEETRKLASEGALDDFSDKMKELARATGTTTDNVFRLGSSFVGLFSSLGATGQNLVDLAANSTKVASELSVITGLSSTEAFNDLAGAVRSFATSAGDADAILERLSDQLISVSDSTGVASNELLDFVGRVGPIAKSAGFELEQLNAIGATLLQGSGVGGAALAEQFGRIISTFGESIDRELARIAINVPEIGLNLEDVTQGNVANVVEQLIGGFDKLTEAQQRQTIASLGSRREGNALATLLQGLTTYNQALAAQVDSAGKRQERFDDISQTLTVTFNQMKRTLEQLGQVLLQGGLGLALEVLIDTFANLVEIINLLSTPLKLIGTGLSSLPKEFREATAAATTFLVALKLLTVLAASNLGTRIQLIALDLAQFAKGAAAARTATAATSTGLGGLTAAFSKINPYVAAGAVAIGVATYAWKRHNDEVKAARERQEALLNSMKEAGNVYATAAQKVSDYVDQLDREAEANLGLGGNSIGGVSLGSPLAGTLSTLEEIIKGDSGKLEAYTRIQNKYNLDLAEVAQSILDAPDAFKALGELESVSSFADLSDIKGKIGDILEEYGDELGSIGDYMRTLLASEDYVDFQIFEQLGDGFAEFAGTLEASLKTANDQTREALEGLVRRGDLSGFSDEDLKTRVQELLKTVPEDSVYSVLALQLINEGIVPDGKIESPEQTVLTNLKDAKAKLDAGLISYTAFAELTENEVRELTQILEASRGSDNELEVAESLREVQDIQAQAIRDRYDSLVKRSEILGEPIPIDSIIDVIPQFKSSPENLSAVADDLRASAEALAGEIVSDSESLGEARDKMNNIELYLPPNLLGALTLTSVYENQNSLVDILGLADLELGEREALLNDVANTIGLSGDVVDSLLFVIDNEISEIIDALLTNAPGTDEAALNARLAVLTSAKNDPNLLSSTNIVAALDLLDSFDLSDRYDDLKDSFNILLKGITDVEEDLEKAGQKTTLETTTKKIGDRLKLLADPNNGTVQQRKELALEILGIYNSLDASQQAQVNAALEVLNIAYEGLTGIELAQAAIVYEALSNVDGAFYIYATNYLGTAGDVINALALNIAGIIATGVDTAQAVALGIGGYTSQLKGELAQLDDIIEFGTSVGADVSQYVTEAIAKRETIKGLEKFNKADFSGLITRLPSNASGFAPINPATSGGGGGGGGDDLEARIAAARNDLYRAKNSRNPLRLAIIQQEAAKAQLDAAKTTLEEIEAQIAVVEADDAFADAMLDLFNARLDLATAVAESMGDTREVLALGVERAQNELDFLRAEGAGKAERLRARSNLVAARAAQRDGLINEDLGDLDFMYKIGEITAKQYVAGLEAILATVDKVKQRDLFREITLTIQELNNKANSFSTNIPSEIDLPSLFEVRRLSEGFSGVVTTSPTVGGNVDNRVIHLTINIADGESAESVLEVVEGALGNNGSFSTGLRVL